MSLDKKEFSNLLFLKSALTLDKPFIDLEGVKQWLKRSRSEVAVHIEKIRFPDMRQWHFDPRDGILYFLMQTKIEPGNVNYVQLSPTLQATKSNYIRVHQGRKPLYLDYFLDSSKHTALVDQLQSEQGARFLKKRNRNMIIRVDEEVPVYDGFAWLTLGQIKKKDARQRFPFVIEEHEESKSTREIEIT